MRESAQDPARAPEIVAPLSRHLSVADLERSLAFYRDVLMFEVRLLASGTACPRAPRLCVARHESNSTPRMRRLTAPAARCGHLVFPDRRRRGNAQRP